MMLPPNVSAVKDRHGRIRYRFRKAGLPSRYLRGEPGTAEFIRSHEDCHDPNYAPEPRRRPKPPRVDARSYVGRSCVYFIGASSGPVKIGTTVNLPARLKKLQTGSAVRLRVLACVDGAAELEALYHERFAGMKVNGEWFQGTEVRKEITRLRKLALSNLASQNDVQPNKWLKSNA